MTDKYCSGLLTFTPMGHTSTGLGRNVCGLTTRDGLLYMPEPIRDLGVRKRPVNYIRCWSGFYTTYLPVMKPMKKD